MSSSSEAPGFYKKKPSERLDFVKKFANLSDDEAATISGYGALGEDTANPMIENVIGTFPLPLGVPANFMINEKTKNAKENIEYIIKTPKKTVIPRSAKQKKYVKALRDSEIVISAGPAGTGKTFLAVAVALSLLLEKKIERIILSRPAVEAGERLGFLPGDMREKVDPYLRPLYDSLYDLLDFEKIQKKIEVGDIEIAPLALSLIHI